MNCKVIGTALKLYGEFDEGSDEDAIEVRVQDPRGSAGLIIGDKEEHQIEIFLPPGKILSSVCSFKPKCY